MVRDFGQDLKSTLKSKMLKWERMKRKIIYQRGSKEERPWMQLRIRFYASFICRYLSLFQRSTNFCSSWKLSEVTTVLKTVLLMGLCCSSWRPHRELGSFGSFCLDPLSTLILPLTTDLKESVLLYSNGETYALSKPKTIIYEHVNNHVVQSHCSPQRANYWGCFTLFHDCL